MLIFLSSASFLFAQDTDDIKELLDNKRYSTAEKLLLQKVETGSETAMVNYMLVNAYLQQDKTTEAKSFLEKKNLTASTGNSDPFNRIAYGTYLVNTGQTDKAKEVFSNILNDKKLKKNFAILSAIAGAHINSENGDVNDAFKIIDLAEKTSKNNAELEILKGNAYMKIGDGSNAYRAYHAAIKDDPSNVEAYYKLGKIFVTQKAEDLYLEQFQKAFSIDSTYVPVLESLYDHYYFRDVKIAKQYLERLIRHSDYSIKNDYNLADIYYLNKDYTKAINIATDILKREKENAQPRLYKMLAYSYFETGDKENAMRELDKYFLKEDPKNIISRDYEFKGNLLTGQENKLSETITCFEKAFSLDTVAKRKLSFAEKLGEAYGKLKEYKSQATWLGIVYELKPERTNVDLYNWGLAEYKAGELEQADTVFGKYIAMYPENLFGYYWRAQVNAAIDTTLEKGLAVPYYKKLIELGEPEKKKNMTMLMKAYGYMGGYDANITKDFQSSLNWFEKILELDPDNPDAAHYAEILKKWINDPDKNKSGEKEIEKEGN